MKKEDHSKEEEKYLQIKESIIHTLYGQRETEIKYLDTIKTLLDYWKGELRPADVQSKERHDELLKLIDIEEATINKIRDDINRIDEMIDKTEKNLQKIREMVTSLRGER